MHIRIRVSSRRRAAAQVIRNLLPDKLSEVSPEILFSAGPIFASSDEDIGSSAILAIGIWRDSILVSSSSAYGLSEIGDWHTNSELGQKQARRLIRPGLHCVEQDLHVVQTSRRLSDLVSEILVCRNASKEIPFTGQTSLVAKSTHGRLAELRRIGRITVGSNNDGAFGLSRATSIACAGD